MSSQQFNLLEGTASEPPSLIHSIAELVEKRTALGISLETVAQQTKLPVKQLLLLEESKFSEMSSDAYARAVARAYGKAIGIDPAPLLQQIGTFAGAAELHNSADVNQPVESRGMMGFGQAGSGSKWVWVGLTLVAIAAAAFLLGPESGRLAGQIGKPSVSAPQGVAISPAVVSPAAPASSAAPEPPKTSAELKIEFQKAGWVEVTQLVDGVEQTQVFSQGGTEPRSFTVSVKYPAKVVVGNAESIKLMEDGKEVDLKPFTDGSIAKLNLPK